LLGSVPTGVLLPLLALLLVASAVKVWRHAAQKFLLTASSLCSSLHHTNNVKEMVSG